MSQETQPISKAEFEERIKDFETALTAAGQRITALEEKVKALTGEVPSEDKIKVEAVKLK